MWAISKFFRRIWCRIGGHRSPWLLQRDGQDWFICPRCMGNRQPAFLPKAQYRLVKLSDGRIDIIPRDS